MIRYFLGALSAMFFDERKNAHMFVLLGFNWPTLAFALTIIGGSRYLYAVLRRTNPATPNTGTWLTWTSVSLLTAFGMWQAGTLSLSPMFALSVVFNCLILLATLRGGWKPLKRMEVGCLVAAACGLVLSSFFCDTCPEIAIVIGVAISVIGSIPTMRSIWSKPQSEDLRAHLCGNTSCLCQLMAYNGWNLATDFQPLVGLLNGLVLTTLILRPTIQSLYGQHEHQMSTAR